MYHLIRSLENKPRSLPATIFRSEGNPITARAETMDRWTEHFKELLNCPPDEPVLPRHTPEQPVSTVGATPLTFVDVEEEVHRLKVHKAAGTDNVLPELYKQEEDILIPALTQLMDMIWNQQAIPLEWKTAIIVAVHEKGDSKKSEIYPGISVLNVAIKNCEIMINTRLGPDYEEDAWENRAGFRPNHGFWDQNFTLRQIPEKICQYNRPTVLTFIDFKATCESVDRCTIRNICSPQGLGQVMVNLLKVMHDEIYCSLKAYDTLSSPLQVTTDIRQGSKLSPLVFLIVIDCPLRETTQDRIFGIQLDDMTGSELDFADGMWLLEDDFNAAQEFLSSVIAAAAKKA